MLVDELPADVKRIHKGTSKKIVHLDDECQAIGSGGVNEWSTHGRGHLKVCRYCAYRHGLSDDHPYITGTGPDHPLSKGNWSTKNEIDVEAAMLEYADEEAP